MTYPSCYLCVVVRADVEIEDVRQPAPPDVGPGAFDRELEGL